MNHLTPTGAAELPKCTAADGSTEVINVPGYPLMVRAVDFNRLRAKVEELSAAQAELAAMRAGGEPVAEMVPCHTPSGKRVAVISRFQHLPIGTKLYTHPSPPQGQVLTDTTTQGQAPEAIAGALFDFAGFLTSLPKERAVILSGAHNAAPVVNLLTEWAKTRGLDLNEANVKGWVAALTQPSDTNTASGAAEQAAYDLGAKGAPPTESERLLFEAWMRGHCWALCATWDGKGYSSDAEQGGFIDPRAMNTRQLWAAWRDRAALARASRGQAPAQRDPDGEAFRTAAHLGLTLRFYGGCAQSSVPGAPSAYEVSTGLDRAAAMREAVGRAAAVIADGGEAQRLDAAHTPQADSVPTGNAHGWVTIWPTPDGLHKPVYSPGKHKPSYGPELDAKLRVYPVFLSADSVLEDAARYLFLRDGKWRDTDLEPVIRLQLNSLWDAKIDAARKQGANHD